MFDNAIERKRKTLSRDDSAEVETGRVLDILPFNSPVLRIESGDFDFSNPPINPASFARDLAATMNDAGALNLAGIQVNVALRVIALATKPQNTVMFNPKIVDASEESIFLEETSVTYPGMSIKIERPRHIKVRFTYPNGETTTSKFTGMTSRLIQQSMDFLNGVNFTSRARYFHKAQAMKRWRKLVDI